MGPAESGKELTTDRTGMIREVSSIPEQRVPPQIIHRRSSSVAPLQTKFASNLSKVQPGALKLKMTNLYPGPSSQTLDYGETKYERALKNNRHSNGGNQEFG